MKTQRNVALILVIGALLFWVVDKISSDNSIETDTRDVISAAADIGNETSVSPIDQGDAITASRRNAITQAVEIVSPSVVGISVKSIQQIQVDPFWEWFYGRSFQREVSGIGSGLIISEDGYIVTSDHVVRNTREIKVTLTDGNTYDARLVESTFTTDIALLKIEGANFPTVKLGDSDNILIGEWAIALGNPFGLFDINNKPSVTVGVISALDRDFGGEQYERIYQDMIQTDASINPGNSGGPLVNSDGEVIGINAFIITGNTQIQGSVGIGFAIPINKVKKVVRELKERAENPNTYWIGFRGYTLNPDIVRRYRLGISEGFFIAEIDDSSPAEKAALQVGDVITAINGSTIRRVDDVRRYIDAAQPRVGTRIALKLMRNFRFYETTLVIERAPGR